jgi:protocatechuate 3,4-dioxygenase beta subunit
MLTPEVTEGPYYVDPKLQRSDIRDGRAGVPLELKLTVVEGSTCKPVSGAQVEVWHADAQGTYSGFASAPDKPVSKEEGQKRYLRGHQVTAAAGAVTFTTVYPGWYRGRTTHIHFKVLLADKTVLTGQLFLPDALSEFIYTQASEYKRPETRDTLNKSDGIAKQATRASFAAVKEEQDRYVASLTIGIDRLATSSEGAGPGRRPPNAPGGRPPLPPPGGEAGPPGEQGRTTLLTGKERVQALLPG